MKDFPKGGFLNYACGAFAYIGKLKIGLHAANACYFIVLSVFPALLLLLGLLRYTGLDVQYLTQLVEGFVPAALMPSMERLIVSTYRNATGAVVSVSALVALWSASRGIHGVLLGLNSIYHVQEDRGWFYTRSVSVVYTFAFLLVLILTLILSVFEKSLLYQLPVEDSPLWQLLDRAVDFRFLLLLLLQTILFTAVFMVFPNRRNRFKDSLPGAIMASFGWLVFSNLFSLYVENFSNYANIYGSVYAVALSMLWLYCCMSIVFYGGALNYYLATAKK